MAASDRILTGFIKSMKLPKNVLQIAFLALLLIAVVSFRSWQNRNTRNISITKTSNGAVLVPVLMYHHVGPLPPAPDKYRQDLTVSLQDFTDQVNYLDAHGYKTVTTAQLDDFLHGNGSLPDKAIVLTFDDGYDDALNNATAVLAAHHMVGSFGIITQEVGQPDYTTWDQIKVAAKEGMEMVDHSQHHIDFTDPKYSYETKKQEVLGGLDDLKKNFGVSTRTFIYPYGHYNADIEKILRDGGFDLAFTTHNGKVRAGANQQNLLELPRVRVHGGEDVQKFAASLVDSK